MKEVKPRAFDIDDGGSFDRLVEETCRLVGTAAGATNLLQFRVLEAFVNRLRKDSMDEKLEEQRKKKNNIIAINDKERAESSKKANSLSSRDLEKEKKLKIVLKRKHEENYEKKKPKNKKQMSVNGGGSNQKNISFKKMGLEPPPKLSSKLQERIGEKGGSDIKLVIMKQISNTDLNRHHGRLSIPCKQIKKDTIFLTEEEKISLDKKEEMRVMVMEPCGVESSMVFVKWKLKSSDTYVLRTSWKMVLERNHDKVKHFKLDDVIQLWSFRVGTQLWFAIDNVWNSPSTSSSSPPVSDTSGEDQLIAED